MDRKSGGHPETLGKAQSIGSNLFWSPMKLCYNFKIRMLCFAPYMFDHKPKLITAEF